MPSRRERSPAERWDSQVQPRGQLHKQYVARIVRQGDIHTTAPWHSEHLESRRAREVEVRSGKGYEKYLRNGVERLKSRAISDVLVRTPALGMLVTSDAGRSIDWLLPPRDAVTPDQDWVITPHPKCGNLYVATAGSFHGWKFLPIIGSYVTRMLHGKLDEEQTRRWAWDRQTRGSACPMYIPTRDLKDLL